MNHVIVPLDPRGSDSKRGSNVQGTCPDSSCTSPKLLCVTLASPVCTHPLTRVVGSAGKMFLRTFASTIIVSNPSKCLNNTQSSINKRIVHLQLSSITIIMMRPLRKNKHVCCFHILKWKCLIPQQSKRCRRDCICVDNINMPVI